MPQNFLCILYLFTTALELYFEIYAFWKLLLNADVILLKTHSIQSRYFIKFFPFCDSINSSAEQMEILRDHILTKSWINELPL